MFDPEPSELFENTDREHVNMGTKILQELDIKREHKRRCRYESMKKAFVHIDVPSASKLTLYWKTTRRRKLEGIE